MSQHDFNIANQSMPAARADINNALLALASQSSGATAPATTYAYQWWYDTTTSILKMRNTSNTAWITFATFNQGSGTFTIAAANVSGLTTLQSTVGQLSGRNLIINGSGRINQRGYVSGTATTSGYQYTLDRWKVIVSGQSLVFSGSDATGYTMTAPAGGVMQVFEATDYAEGPYVLSWTGTATATINGFPVTNGVVTYLYVSNKEITFMNGTFKNVQLERGSTATPFEQRTISEELVLCQRYYETGTIGAQSGSTGTIIMTANLKTRKRATPSVTLTDVLASNVASRSVLPHGDQASTLMINAVVSAAGGYIICNFAANAEL